MNLTDQQNAVCPLGTRARHNPELSFDTLITGKANELACVLSLQVAMNPGLATHNPMFIYGSTGLGKTHLMHAIANRIAEQFPEKNIRYVHAEDYYSDVVAAYRQKSFDVFKNYYRSLDVLLLDDIQYLNGKARTQEELVFAIDALIEAKKQIVISCNTYPKAISGLDDCLISRCDSGLLVPVTPPDLEMRVAILKGKAAIDGEMLEDDVANFIAERFDSNTRELEGVLKTIRTYASFYGRKVDLDLLNECVPKFREA